MLATNSLKLVRNLGRTIGVRFRSDSATIDHNNNNEYVTRDYINFQEERSFSLPHIKLSQDESYFIAHHPDKMIQHPYENTLPLPNPVATDDSLLKPEVISRSYNMVVEAPNMEQLQVLTYTPRHRWYQNRGKDLRKKFRDMENDTIDRPGL